MSKSTSSRGGHRPAGWPSSTMDMSQFGHIGKKMDRELKAAEEGAQFGGSSKEVIFTGEVIRVPKVSRCVRRLVVKLRG